MYFFSFKRKQEEEQTFDVHPADIDEQQGMKTEDGRLPTSFLIRLAKNQQSSSSSSSSRIGAATSCLSSISSKLTVEKCQLRKSRFRISARSLTKSHSISCATKIHSANSANIRYKIVSSDQSCLEFLSTNSRESTPTIAFTKCSSEKLKNMKQTYLWQFCGKNGNCSLSPVDLNWDSLIKVESHENMNETTCTDDKIITTTPTTTMSPTSSPHPATIISYDLPCFLTKKLI